MYKFCKHGIRNPELLYMMDPYNMPLFQGLDPSMNFPYKETSTRQYILVKQFSVKKNIFIRQVARSFKIVFLLFRLLGGDLEN